MGGLPGSCNQNTGEEPQDSLGVGHWHPVPGGDCPPNASPELWGNLSASACAPGIQVPHRRGPGPAWGKAAPCLCSIELHPPRRHGGGGVGNWSDQMKPGSCSPPQGRLHPSICGAPSPPAAHAPSPSLPPRSQPHTTSLSHCAEGKIHQKGEKPTRGRQEELTSLGQKVWDGRELTVV